MNLHACMTQMIVTSDSSTVWDAPYEALSGTKAVNPGTDSTVLYMRLSFQQVREVRSLMFFTGALIMDPPYDSRYLVSACITLSKV